MADDSDAVSHRDRLVRDPADRGPSLAEQLSRRLELLGFGAPWYGLRLKGRYPLRLLAVPADPVPGDPKAGARLKAGRLYAAGHGEAMAEARLDADTAPVAWRRWVHGWGWLRDVAAVAPLTRTEAGRIEELARRWLARFADWDAVAWDPPITGRRILMAIAHAPLVMPGADHIHRSAVLNGIARWARHLDRATPRLPPGSDRVEAAAGLVAAALMLPGGDERMARASLLLMEGIDAVIGSDGRMPARSPAVLAELGDLLLTLEAFHAARQEPACLPVTEGLGRVRTALAALAMGDGQPAAWHGAQPTAAQCQRLGVVPGGAPARPSGFRQLAAGATRIIVDAAPPPPLRLNPMAHASTAAFILWDGDRAVVAGCGGPAPGLPPALVEGLRTTASHSTLTLADTSSSRLHPGSGRAGVAEVLTELRCSGEGQWLELVHDGYRRRFGLDHRRRLWLAPAGDDLRGEDRLLPAAGALARLTLAGALAVAIRFHLAPGAAATLTEDGLGALIRLAPGRRAHGRAAAAPAWAFRARFDSTPGRLLVEPGIFVAADGTVSETQHLLLVTTAEPAAGTTVGWSLRRAAR